ncbi:MAG: Asp23/Gls24 family envelope stress response protein [Eubacteriales bacterium]|nr:Asp23/Gls24 family envelope stress response protein [Clostridiales bacterium]MDD6341391.1 Asp23/Gls24 family envelope stress response protein [Eubacteriales bacterium]MDD7393546.1 Asp23/Gls24 family envelope stress response protein [Eubacteriales bacterium]MDY3761299.1 Asp23/Gls24 family envelope stress response protein [Eubacteriales bacterium]
MLLFENEKGKVVIDDAVIAQIVANAANECFGVAGMAAKNLGEEFLGFFKRDSKDRGVRISCSDNKLNIEMHIVVTYGINIPAICDSIIHKVVYTVEQALDIKVDDIKVFVDAVINK